MSRQPLKLGVVGCGWAGLQAVRAATASPRTEVVAISDLTDELRNRVADEFRIAERYSHYQELLRDDSVEAVYLAVNPVMRYPMVLDAFAAAKHVLVQKPHAVCAQHILTFEAAAAKAEKTLQFCYFMRSFPKNRQIKAAIAEGRIGTPYHARIFLRFNYLPALEGIEKWLHVYGQKGGTLGQHASHELDLVWWWLGCPTPQWAFATKHCLYSGYTGPEGPSEDYFSGLVGFEGGATIQIDCSRWLHSNTPTAVELYGRDGAISGGAIHRHANGEFATETIDGPIDLPYNDAPDPVPSFFYEIERFAMAVEGSAQPEVNAREAFVFMKILDALYDSAGTGTKVTI